MQKGRGGDRGGGNLNRSAQRASVLSGSERWVNKKGGWREEKQAWIQRRSRSFASSGFVITMGADTFPLLIWWDEEFLGGNMLRQNSGGEKVM